MSEYTMGAVEMRFAEIIWEHEPVSSGELVKLCEQELNWKKSTTYTVLRRLCQKGIFISENGVVTSLLSKQMFQARQSEEIIEESFAGSLPDFVAAFTSRKKLSNKEIKELKKIIENNGGARNDSNGNDADTGQNESSGKYHHRNHIAPQNGI